MVARRRGYYDEGFPVPSCPDRAGASAAHRAAVLLKLAEEKRFELLVDLHPRRFSNRAEFSRSGTLLRRKNTAVRLLSPSDEAAASGAATRLLPRGGSSAARHARWRQPGGRGRRGIVRSPPMGGPDYVSTPREWPANYTTRLGNTLDREHLPLWRLPLLRRKVHDDVLQFHVRGFNVGSNGGRSH